MGDLSRDLTCIHCIPGVDQGKDNHVLEHGVESVKVVQRQGLLGRGQVGEMMDDLSVSGELDESVFCVCGDL